VAIAGFGIIPQQPSPVPPMLRAIKEDEQPVLCVTALFLACTSCMNAGLSLIHADDV
jgi:hypothetical protein